MKQIITIPHETVADITATCPDDPALALELLTRSAIKACMEALLAMYGKHIGIGIHADLTTSAHLLGITSDGGHLMSVEIDIEPREIVG